MIRFALGLAFACPCLVAAQPIPRVAFEMAGGLGPHSERAGETWFNDTRSGILRVGGTVRAITIGNRVAAIARADYSVVPRASDRTLLCTLAPNMTCRMDFAKTGGLSLGVGAQASPTPGVWFGVDAGVLRSSANRYVALNAAAALSNHVAFLIDWRYYSLAYASRPIGPSSVPLPSVVDQRVSFRPIELGLRVF